MFSTLLYSIVSFFCLCYNATSKFKLLSTGSRMRKLILNWYLHSIVFSLFKALNFILPLSSVRLFLLLSDYLIDWKCNTKVWYELSKFKIWKLHFIQSIILNGKLYFRPVVLNLAQYSWRSSSVYPLGIYMALVGSI